MVTYISLREHRSSLLLQLSNASHSQRLAGLRAMVAFVVSFRFSMDGRSEICLTKHPGGPPNAADDLLECYIYLEPYKTFNTR